MSLEWEGFLTDARTGNVGGTFEYFDTEAQSVIIRASDKALTSVYSEVELGQWTDMDWINPLRVGNFGLSQFVPRHICNGEIWAIGITPVEVDATTGRFPTPKVEVGCYLYRYKYLADLTPYLVNLDTLEQAESPIKDAQYTLWSIPEQEINSQHTLFSVGSRVISQLAMGSSPRVPLSCVYIDDAQWDVDTETTSVTGRNGCGFILYDQTFDETTSLTGTRNSVVNSILDLAGFHPSKRFIQNDATASAPKFEPQETYLDGLKRILTVWGWRMCELLNGDLVVGDVNYIKSFAEPTAHSFEKDEAFARGLSYGVDGAYSRLALVSYINAIDGDTPVDAFIRTIYVDLSYFDGWSIGNHRTKYISLEDDLSEDTLRSLAQTYKKAFQYIGAGASREIPIHPEIQAGDAISFTDAEPGEYLTTAVISQVKHILNVAEDESSIRTELSIDSGGTIDTSSGLVTYTAADVSGSTRKRELVDAIKRAAKDANDNVNPTKVSNVIVT